jgi:hypothetical protein
MEQQIIEVCNNNLYYFLLYILAAVGLSHVLADSSILAPFRFWLSEKNTWFSNKLLEMMTCYMCSGWWAGLFVAIAGYFGLDWLLWAFAASLVSPLFGFLKLYLSMLTSVDEEEHEN